MTNKMTKRDYFNMIKAAMADNADVVAFVDHELELLDKKNAKSAGPNPEVLEFRAKVLEYIKNASGSVAIAAIAKALGATSQKVTPAVKALVESGDVVLASTVKRVNYYTVA